MRVSTFMLLMPIASPSRLMRGPPELPKVMAASVWMYSGTSRPWGQLLEKRFFNGG